MYRVTVNPFPAMRHVILFQYFTIRNNSVVDYPCICICMYYRSIQTIIHGFVPPLCQVLVRCWDTILVDLTLSCDAPMMNTWLNTSTARCPTAKKRKQGKVWETRGRGVLLPGSWPGMDSMMWWLLSRDLKKELSETSTQVYTEKNWNDLTNQRYVYLTPGAFLSMSFYAVI